jgi:lipopolysaccharide transport system permease protein
MRASYLLREFVRRELAGRYRGSVLGFLWAFVTPLWQLVLYTFIFSYILRVPLVAEGTSSFPIFLFAGLIPWLGFAEGLSRSTTAVVEQSHLVRKHRFPSEILVVSAVVSAACHQLAALGLFAVWQGLSGGLNWRGLFWLIPGLAIQLVLALGLGWIAAAVQVYFRDVVQVIGIGLSGGFYLTPIVYPMSVVPEAFRTFLLLNPLTTVVAAFRTALVGAPAPSARSWLLASATAALLAVAGLALFRRLRPGFADEL